MWPFSHLAVGYLAYAVYTRGRLGRAPTGTEMLLILVGSQLPDLIDKPLVLAGGPFTTGRTVGHSLLVIVPVAVVLALLVKHRTGSYLPALALTIPWLTHPFADGAQLFLQGSLRVDLIEVSFWLWPVGFPASRIVTTLLELPVIGTAVANKSAWTAQHLPMGPELSPYVRGFELCVTALAALVWLLDGAPGKAQLRRRLGGEEETPS